MKVKMMLLSHSYNSQHQAMDFCLHILKIDILQPIELYFLHWVVVSLFLTESLS